MLRDWLDDYPRERQPESVLPGSRPLFDLIEIARELKEHGWTVVSEDLEFPIVLARRRLRWLGLRRRVAVTYGYSFLAVNRGHNVPVVEGVGWRIRDESQLTGRR